jgi:hypothetical protein
MNQYLENIDSISADLAALIDQRCDPFEAALKARGQPSLEQFLLPLPPAGGDLLFQDLLRLELAYRRRWGETPSREDYLGRFPGYTSLIEELIPAKSATATDAVTGTGVTADYCSPRPVPGGEEKPPEYIGRYRVIDRLGGGGQGEVFRAIHPVLGRDVIVKWARLTVSAEMRDKLHDEARILAQLDELNDPGLVKVHDADLHENRPFVVMEHVPGRPLDEILKRERMPLERAVGLVADLAGTLARVHARGVIHRDVKPANVLIDSSGAPRLLDFGLSCLAQAWQEIGPPEEGVVAGTLSYMAPEQARGQADRLGPHTDVFGLGAILYHLLTNRPVFQGKTRQEVLWQATWADVTPPRQINPGIPPALERVCLRALAADPAERTASAGEFEKALRQVSPARPKRRWRVGVGVALVLLPLLALGAWFATRPGTPALTPETRPAVPIKGSVDLLVYRIDAAGSDVLVPLSHPLAMPLRTDDEFKIVAEVDRPAYLYLFWVDENGAGAPVYPWKPGQWGTRPADERPVRGLDLVAPNGKGFAITGDVKGMETIVMLARSERLSASDEEIQGWFAGLKPLPFRGEQARVWFENFDVVRDDAKRGYKIDGDVLKVDGPRGLQLALKQKVGPVELVRAISFARVGPKR